MDFLYHQVLGLIEGGADVLLIETQQDILETKAIIEGANKAFAEKKVEFEVKLIQLVKLIKNKKVLKMSKRAGDYILIQDLLKEVSSDVIRFVMLSRNNDIPLDFDIDLKRVKIARSKIPSINVNKKYKILRN